MEKTFVSICIIKIIFQSDRDRTDPAVCQAMPGPEATRAAGESRATPVRKALPERRASRDGTVRQAGTAFRGRPDPRGRQVSAMDMT